MEKEGNWKSRRQTPPQEVAHGHAPETGGDEVAIGAGDPVNFNDGDAAGDGIHQLVNGGPEGAARGVGEAGFGVEG